MTAFTPAVIPNGAFWFEPSVTGGAFSDGSAGVVGTTAITDTGAIQTMPDLFGNGYVMFEATNKPTYQVAASHMNGAGVMLFNGSTATMNMGKPASLDTIQNTGFTVTFAAYPTATGAFNTLLSKIATNTGQIFFMLCSGYFLRYQECACSVRSGTNPAFTATSVKHIYSYRRKLVNIKSVAVYSQLEELFIDGAKVWSQITPCPAWDTTHNWRLGSTDTPALYYQGELGAVIAYSRALEDTELSQVETYCAVKYGCYLLPGSAPATSIKTAKLFFCGNSLTIEAVGLTPQSGVWANRVLQYTNEPVLIVNNGISGYSTSQLISTFPNDGAIAFDPTVKNIAVVWEITNDWCQSNITAATAYANLVSLCTLYKNAGYYVIAATMIPRGAVYTNTNITGAGGTAAQQAACETGRLAISASVVADFATAAANNTRPAYADVLVDLGNGGNIVVNGITFSTAFLSNYNNATYFWGDIIHLRQAGYDLLIPIFGAAVNQCIAYANSDRQFVGMLNVPVPYSNITNSMGDCLNAARSQGFGKWVFSGTTLTIYGPDGVTAVKTFTLNSSTAPTQRV